MAVLIVMIVMIVDVVGVLVTAMMVAIGSGCGVKLVDISSWRC